MRSDDEIKEIEKRLEGKINSFWAIRNSFGATGPTLDQTRLISEIWQSASEDFQIICDDYWERRAEAKDKTDKRKGSRCPKLKSHSTE